MKHYAYRWLCAVAALILPAGGCSEHGPQETGESVTYAVTRDFYKGPVRVQVSYSSEKANLSDLLSLKLAAQSDPGVDINFPGLATAQQAGDFKIRTAGPLTRKLAENGKLTFERVFEIEPLQTGTCEVPAFTFTFAQGDTTGEVVTEPLTAEVVSTVAPDAEIAIADIEDVVEAPPSPWRWWGGLAGAAAAAGLVVMLLFRPKKAAVVQRIYRPAHEVALEALRALADEKLVEQGRVGEFYQKLSACLRQYIENRFALRAYEQTTEEFLASIGSSDVLQADHKQQLRDFLQHCDLVKFARFEPSVEQINESLSIARRFIESTQSSEHRVDVTEASSSRQEVA